MVLCWGGGDDLGAPSLGQLDQYCPYTRGSGLDQHCITGLHVTPGLQDVVSGEEHDGHTAGFHRIKGVGLGEHQVAVDGAVFGLATRTHRHHLLADNYAGDV